MHSTHRDYVRHVLSHLVPLLRNGQVRERVAQHAQMIVALLLLDLFLIRDELLACFPSLTQTGRTGRPPLPPLAVFRTRVLMAMLGETSLNKWPARLAREPELAVLSGFEPGCTPSIGTLYGHQDRLLDGPQPKPCEHVPVPPSKRRAGTRGKYWRDLGSFPTDSDRAMCRPGVRASRRVAEGIPGVFQGCATQNPDDGAVQREASRICWEAPKQEKAARKAEKPPEGPVREEVERARGGAPQQRDFAHRLASLLMKCGVVKSAHMGLLGSLKRLVVAADGSPLESHAQGRGLRPDPTHDQDGERFYTDPTATWGWDSHRDRYSFGHRIHALVTTHDGLDLPLLINVHGAHRNDSVVAPVDLVRFLRQLEEALPDAKVQSFVGDTGYDANALYELIVEHGIAPVIPLHPNAKTPEDSDGVPRDEHGTPLCAAGLPMRLHGFNKRGKKNTYNCPVKRPTRVDGKQVFVTHEHECPLGALCEPDTVMGPLVHIREADSPRLNLPFPRGSERFKLLMNKRTCTERFFGWVKARGGLGRRPYRRDHLFAIAALSSALAAHAFAWVKHLFGTVDTADRLLDVLDGFAAQLAEAPAA